MLEKFVSVWLVFLTLTPFTAPYPTCDLTLFLTGRAAAPAHATSQASLADASLSQAVPLFRASARVRLVAFAECPTGAHAPAPSAASVAQHLDLTSASSHHRDLTILRI
jgi:hypothetical protein